MSLVDTVRFASDGSWGIQNRDSGLMRQPPEPRNSAGRWGQVLASTLSSAAGTVLGATGVGGIGGGLGDVSQFQDLLGEQMRIQLIMQTVTMESNISKSKHEIEMAPIRNMRVG
jgi:hypothetical protein